jgi:tetratricopeptide (TPR) repeat protein
VGQTHNLNVGDWLAERIATIRLDEPFERLLEELLTADTWLSTVPEPHNRHSFSVGAFVGSEPVFALISNFEQPSGVAAITASPALEVFRMRPTKPRTFASGQAWAVARSARKRLAALAAQDPTPQRMYAALAQVNRGVADRTKLVSHACFAAHVRLTGEGGGCAHEIGDRPFVPKFAFPEAGREAITRLLDEQFGPGRARLVSMSTARADPSDEYHETQLREKPEDPGAHSNYGVYLKEKKGDLEGAEREYRRAIELNGNHVNGLGNLANLLWEKGDKNQASEFYRRALEVDPGNENVTWNYARFVLRELDDRATARKVVDQAIAAHPDSGRLLLLQGDLCLLDGAIPEALDGYRRARERGADQRTVEAGYATAVQLSGAPFGECIGAYRVAIALSPENAALRLNLAQLMFVKGDNAQANSQLREAMRLGLDESAQLEAHFYFLSHTSSDPAGIFQTTKSLLARGARLRWDVRPNIEKVAQSNPRRATLLELVSWVMSGKRDQSILDDILARWA